MVPSRLESLSIPEEEAKGKDGTYPDTPSSRAVPLSSLSSPALASYISAGRIEDATCCANSPKAVRARSPPSASKRCTNGVEVVGVDEVSLTESGS